MGTVKSSALAVLSILLPTPFDHIGMRILGPSRTPRSPLPPPPWLAPLMRIEGVTDSALSPFVTYFFTRLRGRIVKSTLTYEMLWGQTSYEAS
jgi:hypothetical protein